MVQLQQARAKFRRRGIGLAAVSYDNGPGNRPDYAKRDMAYPGFIYLDARGTVREKFFGGSYFDRYTANNLVAKLFPELLESAAAGPAQTPHLRLTLKQSDRGATLGSRVTLAVDVRLPRGTHVYAPEVKGYRSVRLLIDSVELVRPKEAQYPRHGFACGDDSSRKL